MFNFFNNDSGISFSCKPFLFDVIPKPVPASKLIPKWYKDIKPTVPGKLDGFARPYMTAKKCMPLIDAFGAGWIIPLCADVNIRTSKDNSFLEIGPNPDNLPVSELHVIEQVGGKGNWPGDNAPPLKFINHWLIKTNPGWSCLIIPPINHFDKRFTCLGAVVDTDTYDTFINFPAVWHILNHDNLIKAGTPLVQVIPFKRKTLDYEPQIRPMTSNELSKQEKLSIIQSTRTSYYTEVLRDDRNNLKE